MVHLICTFDPPRASFLEQFINHYFRLGAERFHLSMQVEPAMGESTVRELAASANRFLAPYDLALSAVLQTPFTSLALRAHHDQIQSEETGPGDWIIWADIDEFQVYPGEFGSLIQLADAAGIDYFRGYFIDRAAPDGRLKRFEPEKPIWSQYPRQFHLQQPREARHKVTCARNRVRLTPGNHYPVNTEPLRYFADPVEVHHFKWDESVFDRLRRRQQPDFQASCPWWVDSRQTMDYIQEHGGVITPD